MKFSTTRIYLLLILTVTASCKKQEKASNCYSGAPTVRQIDNKKAVVKLTATYTEPVYLVEEGTIDTRLIPCNFPMEFYQNDLRVTISGETKATRQTGQSPCCTENFVITKISR